MRSVEVRMPSSGLILLTTVLWLLVVLKTPSVSSTALLCPHHFGQKVKECLEPYWSVAALFNRDGPRHDLSDVLEKHLCL